MKILIVTQYFWPENFKINEICIELKNRGHEVEILTGLPNVPDGKYYKGYSFLRKSGHKEEYNGMPIHRLRILQRHNNFINLSLNCASFVISGFLDLPRLLRKKYDLVFSFQVSPVTSALPAKWYSFFKRIPSVIYILDIWPESMYFLINMKTPPKWFDFLCRGYCKSIYKSFDKVMISSKRMMEKLELMNINKNNIEFMPNSADKLDILPYNNELADKYNLKNKFVISFAGNIGRAQGLDMIIDAAYNLKDNINIVWFIIGDGTERQRLIQKAKEKNIDNIVIFPGWQSKEQLSEYISISSTLTVILKDNEILNLTVPAKVQTYLSMGKPILASMNGEAADVIFQSKAGLVSSADNLEEYCNNVRKMQNMSKEEFKSMGVNGINYCKENYDSKILYDRLNEYLINTQKEINKSRKQN